MELLKFDFLIIVILNRINFLNLSLFSFLRNESFLFINLQLINFLMIRVIILIFKWSPIKVNVNSLLLMSLYNINHLLLCKLRTCLSLLFSSLLLLLLLFNLFSFITSILKIIFLFREFKCFAIFILTQEFELFKSFG